MCRLSFSLSLSVCVCVCVRACVRACVRVCVRVCWLCSYEQLVQVCPEVDDYKLYQAQVSFHKCCSVCSSSSLS